MRIASVLSGWVLPSAALVLTALQVAACAEGGTSELPTPVLPSAAVATPTRTNPTMPATVTPGVTRATASPAVTPSPTRSGTPESRPGRLSANDVIGRLGDAKVTTAQTGLSVLCGSGPASNGRVWQASAQGVQQQFVVWEYPDHASLEADWVADIGKAPQPRREGCVSGGSGYWNENLVMYIQGRDLGPLTAAIRDAFLSVGP